MIGRVSGLADRWLSRSFVERRFVSSRALQRAEWLRAQAESMRTLTETHWFAEPTPLAPETIAQGLYRGLPTKTFTWTAPVIEASRKLGVEARSGAPLAMHYGGQRNAVWILLHGWLGGSFAIDRRDWPFGDILRRFDLVQMVLPGHGPRSKSSAPILPSFPTRHPVANAIGLATATAELRQLVHWLRSSGYERIGVAATSIGANAAALFATTPTSCERLVLDRPLVRMSEPLRTVAARCGSRYLELLECLEAVYEPVDPLRRPLRLDSTRISLLLGQADGIAGAASGSELAEHFKVRPTWFPGGHALPVGRRAPLQHLLELL